MVDCNVREKRWLVVAWATIEGFGTVQKVRKTGGWIDRITLKRGSGSVCCAFFSVPVLNKGSRGGTVIDKAATEIEALGNLTQNCFWNGRAIKGNRVIFVVSSECSVGKLVKVLARERATHSIDATEAANG